MGRIQRSSVLTYTFARKFIEGGYDYGDLCKYGHICQPNHWNKQTRDTLGSLDNSELGKEDIVSPYNFIFPCTCTLSSFFKLEIQNEMHSVPWFDQLSFADFANFADFADFSKRLDKKEL